MRIGYVGTNYTLGTKTSTFRLAAFTPERARETAERNLEGTLSCLKWNAERGIGFFRISSGIIPFASHPVSEGWDWRSELRPIFEEIGAFANLHNMRLGTHPGQYTLLNSPRESVVQAAIAELGYHADMLDEMGVPDDARLQIHVGGAYESREDSLARWVAAYKILPEPIRRRLAVENDERLFGLVDCLYLNDQTGVPVIFDVFHHSLKNESETLPDAYRQVEPTWGNCPMQIDYSSQNADRRFGAHTDSIVPDDFRAFLVDVPRTADVMLEIKDKETSAMHALAILDPARGPYVPPEPELKRKPKPLRKKKAVPDDGGASEAVVEDEVETGEVEAE